MTEREKIAHLLRRFGFGAGTVELAKWEAKGFKGTLDGLLNFEKVPENFHVPPYQFGFRHNSPDTNFDPRVFTDWWALSMGMTERPLEQKLALFWHNLLVVGADKVGYGPMNLEYLQILQKQGTGPFVDLLTAVSKTPAMLRYLDGVDSMWGAPNENFGREVMELFTLGIGNYTEQDVKEAARAFTGWWYRSVVFEGNGKHYNDRVREFLRLGRPLVCFADIPGNHDPLPKTILGTTKNFTGEEVLAFLAARPETARRIGKRIWEFFGSPKASPAITEKLAASFKKHQGHMRMVLSDLAHMDEFWSPACVGQQLKSPADFVVGLFRHSGIQKIIHDSQTTRDPSLPVDDPLRQSGEFMAYHMETQGLLLLHPTSVKGWDWGEAWINTNNMLKRMQISGDLLYRGLPNKMRIGDVVGNNILAQNPKDDETALDLFLATYDAHYTPEKRQVLLAAFLKAGGLKALAKKNNAPNVLNPVARLTFGSPEFQYC